MNDIQKLFMRQAQWQKERKSLSWPEKIHMAEAIRESVLQFRGAVQTSAPRWTRKRS